MAVSEHANVTYIFRMAKGGSAHDDVPNHRYSGKIIQAFDEPVFAQQEFAPEDGGGEGYI